MAHVDAFDIGGSWRWRESRKHAKTHAHACASNLSKLQRAPQRSTVDVHCRSCCSQSRQPVHCTSRHRISVGEMRVRGEGWGRMLSRVGKCGIIIIGITDHDLRVTVVNNNNKRPKIDIKKVYNMMLIIKTSNALKCCLIIEVGGC